MNALEVHAPGSAVAGRIACFKAPSAVAGAVLVLLEPPDSVGTLQDLFNILLSSDRVYGPFIERALERVRNFKSSDGTPDQVFRALATAARQGFDGFDRMLDPSAAEALLESLKSGTIRLA